MNKSVGKLILNQSSIVLLVLSFIFLASCIYYVGFVVKITDENKAHYLIKEKIIQIVDKDDLLHSLINHAINNPQTKKDFDLVFNEYTLHSGIQKQILNELILAGTNEEFETDSSNLNLRKLELAMLTALKTDKSNEIKNQIATYDDLRMKNREHFARLHTFVNHKIKDNEIETTNKLLVTRILIVLNILFVVAFFLLQFKKIQSTMQQSLKVQNEKDEAQEHMTIVGELTAGINHEIKNIICIAGLHSNQLSNKLKNQTSVDPEEVLNSVQKIETSVNRAEKIIRSVSKLSYDSSHDDKKDLAVYQVFTETEEFADYFAKKNDVQLRIIPITARLKIHCHPVQISQVLLNLIKNSTEAIESLTDRWVELKAEWDEKNSITIITVVDSGNGIPESVRERLFQKQFSTKAPGKGTGLGLSISAKIINDHGGEIYIDNKAPNTTFVIKLPAFFTEGSKVSAANKAS